MDQVVGCLQIAPCDVVPLLDIDGVVETLTTRLQAVGSGAQFCPRAPPTQAVVSCTYEQWFKPYSPHRRYCQLPIPWGRMQHFLQFRLVAMACLLLQGVSLALLTLIGRTGCACVAAAALLVMRGTLL